MNFRDKYRWCSVCKGMGNVTWATGNAIRFGMEVEEGKPWTRTVDESRAALLQVIEPIPCEECGGTGLVPV